MSDRTGLEIAVIGVAGRFPGAADVEVFWRNLCGGIESIASFSREELLAAGLDPAIVNHPSFVPSRGALEGVDLFDAALFDLSPREAEILDPQHRLFLECAWEALENAGWDPLQAEGLIGVYGGAGPNTYLMHLLSRPDLVAAMGNFQLTLASEKDYLATRTSFKLGLRGPSVVVQTACSTSLVAIHMACQSLLAGECHMALAGGVRVVSLERSGYFFREGSIDSPDGHCRAFDAQARGTVSGSGVGVVVLKRLEDALAEGDRILAVIKGSAVNNDGSLKVGYTAPSIEGQVAVVRMAQSIAEVAPETVGYIEAHGTGTELGDPVEIAALTRAFGITARGTCAIGSVKTNIGHLDAAAGVAGLIKTLLAVERGLIPPSLHCEQPNPEIGFDATPFYVSSRLETWKRGGPRRAGVSSFGIGGTNAHVVLEEPPAQPPSCPGRPWQLLVLSAKTATALERRARDLAEHLRSHPQEDLADVAFTCHLGRRRLAHRRIAVCRDAQEAAAALGSGDPQRTLGRVQEASDRPVAFLFPGQGCQHVGMAQGLYRSEPAFAEQLDRCAEILAAHLGLDLRRVLYPAPEEAAAAGRALERTALAQPAIFAFEYSLARLWMDWGVRPRAMLGHSIGEFVAACLAGVMELEDALALVAARGRLMQELPEGAMLAVPMGEGEVAPLLEESLSVAAVNGPRHCVAAGPVAAVERLQQELAGRGLEVRRLHTSHAFHSSLMDPACEPFRDRVRAVRLAPPQIPYLSNLTGSWVSADQATDPVAWARHLREPVRFGDALETLLEIPDLVLVEVGPGRTLTTLVKSHPAWSRSPDVIRSLGHPGERGDDVELLLTAVGRLWLAGAPVDGKGLYRGQRRRRLALPAYPFERRRFWVDPAAKAGSLPAAPMAEAMAVAAGAGESLAPAPAQGHARPELETVYVAPRSAVEETLAGIWQTLLGIQRIGVHDDFFELGGHSLLMTQAVAHVERSLGLAVSLRALFESPTVARQAELLERLRAEAGSGVPSSGLPAIEPDSERLSESFPLTDVQRAYWIGRTDAVELGNVATHTYTELDVAGLDLGRLEGALQRLIDRQHMLRAIVLPDGRQQILASVPPYRIRTLDLTGSSAERTREALAEVRDEMSHQVLPSDRWPLFELRASCLAGGKVRLHFSFDFLLGDAWSFRVLFTELGRFYADLQTEMAPLELSFRDYVLAEQALAGTELHRRSLEYWRSRLATLPPAPELPLARNPAQILRPRFARRAHRLGSARWEGLKKRAARFGLTPSGVLLAAFGEALARWSKSPRFTLNLTLFNRLPLHSQVNQLIGDFTSLTLLEVDGSGEEPFVDRARRLQSRLLEDLDHRYVSGVRVLRELALLQGRGHGGAMPVVFTSLLGLTVADGRATDPSGELARLEGEVVYSISQTPQVWLDHQAAEADGDLSFNWDVVEELFPEGLIDAVFAGYCRLLDRLADGEDAWRETSPLPLLSGRPALTAPDLAPAGETLHGLFLAQALRRPDRTAVVSRDGSLTYGELDRLSSGIAARLRRLGARPGRLVAVVMEKGCEQVAAVLGVLRSGAAYLPVDPALPRERRWHLLRYGEAQVALTQPWLDESPEWPEGVERVAVSLAEDGPAESEPPPPVASAEDLAYVIFTSGSTGLPKGVMIDHRGAVNTILDINRRFGVGPDDRVLAVSSLSFDLSVYDIFGLLAAGGTVVMPDASQGPDPEGWCRWMARERVTLWNSVPALMEILTESPGAARGMPGAVRLVLLSGDWIPLPLPARIGELAPDAEVVSLGGATEASIWSILHPIADVDPAWKSIPYGRAMARQSVQVLDSRLEPRPVWVPGDLYIGGIGLAQGYWRDEEKTRASFIRHPRTGERLYRTGDLGRYLPGGVIEFLGREDHQVKIGGHRIELGEIEAGLGEHPDVQSCVVTTSGQARGARRLVAYVVPEPAGEGAGADALERFLRARLPAYMVPVAFVVLPALPLTPNGKVDRRALPEPESPQPTGSARPRSPVEEALAGIWANVLGLDGVGIHDDFFALGGDSLQATRVIARIRDTLDAELALRQLFETPTVAGLAVRIEEAQRQRAVPRLPPIMRVLERDRLPLSFGQERLWFLDRLEPGNPAYNLPGAVQLSGTLDRAALAASLSEIVRRHEVLRTTFVPTGEGPVQVIAPPASEGLPLPLVDVSALAPGEREREARRIAREEAASPFDLRCGPVRARLLRFAPHDHAVLWNTHHIVSDGWSGMVFLRELAALYAAYARRLPSPLADPPIQYGDYAVWQRAWLQGRTLEDLLADWRGRLAGAPSALVLPTDRPRPPVLSSRGGYRTFRLSAEVAGRLGALARSEGATTFMVLAAGLAALLRRYSGQDDVLIGTPIANRSQVEVEDLIGFFANTLVLRLDLAGDPGFRELLVRSREVALWAYARQALPFEKLVEAVQPERSLARAPLFQVLFVLQNAGSPAVELPGLELRPLPVDLAATKLDLTLTLTEAADGVLATLEFSADLFDASTIERMAGHFCRLVAEAVDDPQRPVSELPLLTGPERQLLIEWNDTSRAYGVEVWIQEMFEERAAAAPDAVAVVFESTFVSYGALSRRSNHLAQRLVSLGVGPDVAVGVCAERSPALMIALLAVLKAGGAYLPLDPDYPQDRLAFMLDDARASVLLAQESLLHCLPPRQAPVLLLDALPGEAAGAPVRPVDGAHLAYVLYTSGSTGRPKGVMVPHVGIRNRLLWMQEAYRLTAGDRVLQKTPFSFDVSVWELFWPLLAGARLVLARPGGHRDSVYLADLIADQGGTVIHFVPSMLRVFVEEPRAAGCHSLRAVVCSGEALPPDLRDRALALLPGAGLYNLYGPTEASVDITAWTCDRAAAGRIVPIGRPIANSSVHVLDAQFRPQPVGVPGELCLGGVQLARGYLSRPDLTAERFVPDPCDAKGQRPGARLYRTGDLARWLPDGAVEFLGRLDHQVKVRGFRIELGEIEAVLLQHPAIHEAVVVAHREGEDTRLAAYFVAAGELQVRTLREHLAAHLPAFMVPSWLIALPYLPLSSNGKLDRKALPAPGRTALPPAERVAPRNGIEEVVASIWSSVLGVGQVGVKDDFFVLGGHSLAAGRVVSQLREIFAVEVPLRRFFEAPTVEGIAGEVSGLVSAGRRSVAPRIERVARDGPLPLSFAQERLWFLHVLQPASPAYNIPLAVRLRGALIVPALAAALGEVVRRHEVLRSLYGLADGRPVQRIEPSGAWSLAAVDIGHLPPAAREREIERLAAAEAARAFELERDLSLRAVLVRLASDEHALLLVAHHIAVDGWSMEILVQEVGALYAAAVRSEPSPLPGLPFQYADFATWQRSWLDGAELARLLEYWRAQLSGAPAALELATDRPRPPARTLQGARRVRVLSPALTEGLRTLSRRERATPFMVLLASFGILLSRWAGQDNLIVGSPIANRTRAELERLIGCFVNTLALRIDLAENPGFGELVGRMRRTVLDAYAHQEMPFEKLVQELQVERALDRSPLFQVMLALQNAPAARLDLPSLEAGLIESESRTSKFDLTLTATEGSRGLSLMAEYSTDLFDGPTIERWLAQLELLLAEAIAFPDRGIDDLPWLDPALRLATEARRGAPPPPDRRPRPAAPRSGLERRIAAIWREVLHVDQVGLHDNFFELGGHSLLLVEVRRRLVEMAGRDLSIDDMFRHPTVSSLAVLVGGVEAPARQPAPPERSAGPAAGAPAIAIIGMSGRFPGAGSIPRLWQGLRDGVEAISFFSEEELRSAGVPAGLLGNPAYVRARGLLADADAFDARFFGYSPREAELIDPQHRVFLECAWEALEDSGYDPSTYPGRIGVFAGVSANTYWLNLLSHPEVAVTMDQAVISNDKDFLPTRVSYKLDLRGPSVNVQTACSTSLVAVHMACRCLRDGEAEIVLAGGASVRSPRPTGYLHQEGGILSPDGHCRAFDARANGTLPGDGVGVVVLKRLQDALADGDRIHAVILGSAANNDGAHKVGFTAPSVEGQAEVIRQALAAAGVGPETVSYVEAHGTATAMGDPIEVAALTIAYGPGAEEGRRALGSVKTNIGHLDAAAGVAGLIKAVLALENRSIPPSLHFTEPNPAIDFARSPFRVPREFSPWPAAGFPRRAGVSSFGMGGTNVHMILEEAPQTAPPEPGRDWQLLVLSARSGEALAAATAGLAEHLAGREEELADLAYTLQVGRRAFEHRRTVVCRRGSEAARALLELDPQQVATGDGEPRKRRMCFLFPGQGSQRLWMGRELYGSEAGFRETVDRCLALLGPQPGAMLRAVFDPASAAAAEPPDIDATRLAQPALFVCEYALARLWMEWGVEPAALAGHSIGEYVAACLSGVFSLEQCLDLVAERGRLMQSLPGGRMIGIAQAEEEVRQLLDDQLSLAAVNGPGLCVVSGPLPAVDALEGRLAAAGVHCRALAVSHAFHSGMVEPILEPFRERLRRISLRPPEIPFLSNLTGTWIRPEEATDPDYWVRHLRQTVRFADNLRELLRDPDSALLEVGPGRTLGTLAERHPDKLLGTPIVASLPAPSEDRPQMADLLAGLGKLWIAGVEVRWQGLHGRARRRRVAAPLYPFQRQRYWISPQQPQLVASPRSPTGPSEWLYLPSWKKTVPPEPREGSAARSPWLVLQDACGLGRQIVAGLREAGGTVVSVVAGERFEDRGAEGFALAPGDPEGYRALLGALRSRGLLPRSVVHLWSVTPAEAPTRASCERQLDLGFYSLLFLIQAIEEQMPGEPLRLDIVSTGMQPVTGGDPIDPTKATLMGACRTLPRELPDIACRSIDLLLVPASRLEAVSRQLAAELLAEAADPVVAYRGTYRWVEAMEPVRLAAPSTPPPFVRHGGTWLITGGLGGMALELADHLASVHGARLALVGRTPLPERSAWDAWISAHGAADRTSRKILRLRELERKGGEVLVLNADVADLEQMRQAVGEVRRRFGVIHGVIHAAGAPPAGLTQWKTRDMAAAVLAPKVTGTWILDELFGGELDVMVLCSSLSSVVGQMGRIDYCAANAFLDAFAHFRFATGRTHIVSIGWDTWRDAGMAFEEALRRGHDPHRVIAVGMSAEEGAEVFLRALDARSPQLVVSIEDFHTAAERLQPPVSPAADPGLRLRGHPRPDLSTPYEASQNEAERVVAGIWQGVFGIEEIGIHDDFFELGGDSIISLQIHARLHEAGLRLTPRQVFELRTVAEMAAAAASCRPEAAGDQAAAGEVPLTPIQLWFFARGLAHPHQFNQSMLAVVRRPLAPALLRRAVEALLDHHDALRLRCAAAPAGWRQWLDDARGEPPAACIDLSGLPGTERRAATERATEALQRSLDLALGPLLRVVFFDFGAGAPGRLMIVVHHLAIDAVSWRILLADLQTAYLQLESGQRVVLPARTTSFQRWSRRLREHAGEAEVASQMAYWADERRRRVAGLPVERSTGANSMASARTVTVTLDSQMTRALLHDLARAHRVQVQEALLTGLALSLRRWMGPEVLLDIEGHGREPLLEDIDLSRTVGWFTALFPLLLHVEATDPVDALRAVKEQMRALPGSGLGYGLLRHLRPEGEAMLGGFPVPQIVFLYLGQLDLAGDEAALLTSAPEPGGAEVDPGELRSHVLEIIASVTGGELRMSWIYSENLHDRVTVERMAEGCLSALRDLVLHSGSAAVPAYTTADFPRAGLTQAALDDLLAELQGGE